MKKNIIFGFLGNILDARGKGSKRWLHWRPSIDICAHTELPISRFELLIYKGDRELAEQIADDIKILSPCTQVNIFEIDILDPWDFEQVYTALWDIAKHYSFNTDSENYYLHITTGTHVAQICWFLLAESRFYPSKLLQTSPPNKKDKNSKLDHGTGRPTHTDLVLGKLAIIDLDLSCYDKILSRFQLYTQQATELLKSGIPTRNQQFNKIIAEIEQVASDSHAPILLNGATGSGKSFLAKQIYLLKYNSHQISGQFVEINCATIRGDTAMSTLFGHAKGAFTGANSQRIGLLKSADGGLLFLDEIGELGLDEQAMLLKAIEEKIFYPFGSDMPIKSNFQLIAGTNKDLNKAISAGKFREDLYERINIWHYELPSLAERKEDIEPNIEYELIQYAKEYGQLPRFNADSRKNYLDFAISNEAIWKGNFRELNASITRMATLAPQCNIALEQVTQEINRLRKNWCTPNTSNTLISEPIDEFDRYQLEQVIKICQQSTSLSEAGRKLFAVSRLNKQCNNDADRLKKYLAKFDLNWERIKNDK
ncbi:AAA family ATPase [Entomomonas moraniae]|uniref:AAA family ATPase n=1 Tax=Entomomonas moraniae TaxID=2213226 RepID=A0A3Q9JMP5_9GAMM|nr:RNA repair transcriptional activator RtcR [Entomomonas moraniae]AZS51758.1 AAA family ATPase [Entomomonas moraniae]